MLVVILSDESSTTARAFSAEDKALHYADTLAQSFGCESWVDVNDIPGKTLAIIPITVEG